MNIQNQSSGDDDRCFEGHSTIILNAALRDPQLSYRAKGVLAAALTHASSLSPDRAWINAHGTEGRDAITTAIAELKACGYVRDEYQQDCRGGIQKRLVWSDAAAIPGNGEG